MTTEETRSIFCVTNTMRDFRSCIHRGVHESTCDGNEYAWNERRDREETTGRTCKGCLPREARHGHLCLNCWTKVENALSDWPMFEMKIEGVTRAVQRDNGGISGQSIGYVPIPGTVLAVDEIRSYLRGSHSNADRWVSTAEGAANARRFARALEGAMRTHAVEEKSHKLHRVRCPECATLTFVWNPPSSAGGDITVTCQNPNCQKIIREHDTVSGGQEKLDVIATIEDRRGKVPAANIRAGGRDEFAEPYNPTRPEHAGMDPLSILTKAQLQNILDPDRELARVKHLRKADLIAAIHEKESA